MRVRCFPVLPLPVCGFRIKCNKIIFSQPYPDQPRRTPDKGFWRSKNVRLIDCPSQTRGRTRVQPAVGLWVVKPVRHPPTTPKRGNEGRKNSKTVSYSSSSSFFCCPPKLTSFRGPHYKVKFSKRFSSLWFFIARWNCNRRKGFAGDTHTHTHTRDHKMPNKCVNVVFAVSYRSYFGMNINKP